MLGLVVGEISSSGDSTEVRNTSSRLCGRELGPILYLNVKRYNYSMVPSSRPLRMESNSKLISLWLQVVFFKPFAAICSGSGKGNVARNTKNTLYS